jgi:hypothetical protein
MLSKFTVCIRGSFSSVGLCCTLFAGHVSGYGKSPCFRRRAFMSPTDLAYGRLFFEYLNIANIRECA